MDDRRFTSGLNIATCFLRMLADELSAEAAPSDPPFSAQRFNELRRNIECCVFILESLQASHGHSPGIQKQPEITHSSGWLAARGQSTGVNLIWLSYPSTPPCVG